MSSLICSLLLHWNNWDFKRSTEAFKASILPWSLLLIGVVRGGGGGEGGGGGLLPVILEDNCEMKCVYPKFTTCYLVTWHKMVKLPCYLILCQCYLDTYNWCHVTLIPEIFFHCYLVTCPKYPMLPCYLKTVNRPRLYWQGQSTVCQTDIFIICGNKNVMLFWSMHFFCKVHSIGPVNVYSNF